MININTRISGALLLVVVSMMLVSMACYSGQIPGVFELTPYYTETPLPVPEESRFQVGDLAFAPQESNRAFFNLTVYPEPLQDNLVNSKEMCQAESTARILFVGQADDGQEYYLVDCEGSVGWSSSGRLAGPLTLDRYDLGITVAEPGQTQIEVLDPTTFQAPIFAQPCQPGTITEVKEITANDTNDDGVKDIYYRIECPRGSDILVAKDSLFGPLELNVGEKALAVSADAQQTGEYRLASEPAPLTEDNAVEGSCEPGGVMEALEVRYLGGEAYYRVTCGDIEGWTTQERFVGPLLYSEGDNVLIYVEPVFIFADQVPQESGGQVVAEEEAVEEPVAEPAVEEVSPEQRPVVAYQAPLNLLAELGAEEPVVVGQCVSGSIANILEVNRTYYAEIEEAHYRVTCESCVATEENADGELVCTSTETYEGWVPQENLEGPIPYVPGEQAAFAEDSALVEEFEEGVYARIPIDREAAFSIGRFTSFAGRCPVDEGVTVLDVKLEQSRTGTSFNFYYQVECMGEPATYTTETDASGTTRPVVNYEVGASELIQGWVMLDELQVSDQ